MFWMLHGLLLWKRMSAEGMGRTQTFLSSKTTIFLIFASLTIKFQEVQNNYKLCYIQDIAVKDGDTIKEMGDTVSKPHFKIRVEGTRKKRVTRPGFARGVTLTEIEFLEPSDKILNKNVSLMMRNEDYSFKGLLEHEDNPVLHEDIVNRIKGNNWVGHFYAVVVEEQFVDLTKKPHNEVTVKFGSKKGKGVKYFKMKINCKKMFKNF